jgi:hypothetical protein
MSFMLRSGKGDSSAKRTRRAATIGLATVGLALFAVAPVIGEGTNTQPEPAAHVIAATHPATHAQVAGAQGLASVSATTTAKKKKKKSRTGLRRITIASRITNRPIVTEEGKGTYVGIKCPKGSKAISGGVVSPYINLLISSSSPNKPTIDGKYTPNVWWLAVTNLNVDGTGGTLSWHGVVNCATPVRVVRH